MAFPNGDRRVRVLSVQNIDRWNAETVYNHVREQLEKSNVDMAKLSAICTDGASVMRGKYIGVMKRHGDRQGTKGLFDINSEAPLFFQEKWKETGCVHGVNRS